MKTLEEFSKEVMSSKELQKELLSVKPENIEGFLKDHGCEATKAEVEAFISKKQSLSDEELTQVAAGEGEAKDYTLCHCTDPTCLYYEHNYYLIGNKVGLTFKCESCNKNTLVGIEFMPGAERRKF